MDTQKVGRVVILLLATLLLNTNIYADMSLDSEATSISFVSVKKGTIAEAHTIDKSSGMLTDSGEMSLTLDLSSVNTKIDIRNERMKKHLFEIDKFATATITATLDNLPVKEGVSQLSAEGKLSLHGISKSIKVDVTVMRSGDKLMVASTRPIIINAADYGMEGGITMLQKLAKLPAITAVVPVSFVLVFSAKK